MNNYINISSDYMRRDIFSAAGMDWWIFDLSKKQIHLGEEVVNLLNLNSNDLSFYEFAAIIDENHRKDFIDNIYHSSVNSKILIPLKKSLYNDIEGSVYVVKREAEILYGYVKINDKKSNSRDDIKLSFLANMSHELRTPINVIMGFSKILAETDDYKEKEEYLKIILDNNDILLQLINDILDLSKLEAGVLDVHYSDVDIKSVIKEIGQSISVRMKNPDVQFVLKEPSIKECYIYTDKNRLSQVVNNFINNAIKFTTEGTITLGYDIEGDNIKFYVSDTGVGIPEDKRVAIFDRFVRLDNNVKGTGLGLEISSSIIKKLGGHIGVESVYGAGSTFWFSLPYELVFVIENKDSHIHNETYHNISMEVSEKQTILIAEDDPSNYKLCEVLLKKKYNLVHAENGVEAVSFFKKINPDLILMDINMPEMNGYEATKKIRELSWGVPIIAVTAYALADDEQKILKHGFDAYLSKPLFANKLYKTIDSFLLK